MEKIEHKQRKKIAFIGGGPGTMGFLCYLYQKNKIEEFFNNFEMIIFEKTPSFGAGTLGEYGINCNIPALLFTTGINPKQRDKDPMFVNGDNSKTHNIFKSSLYTYLKIQEYTISFPLLTKFLESQGNFLLYKIYMIAREKVFQPFTYVDQIEQNQEKCFVIQYTNLRDNTKEALVADYLVLANGGTQRSPSQQILQYLAQINKMENFYYSD